MARFLFLNFEDFGLNQDITKSIQSQTLFCICCLDKNVSLIDLKNCSHSSYLDSFSKPQTNLYKHVVCYHCHGMLKKIDSFKKQVEKSFTLLSETFTASNITCIKKPTLETAKTVNIFLEPIKPIKNQTESNNHNDFNLNLPNVAQGNTQTNNKTVKKKPSSIVRMDKLRLGIISQKGKELKDAATVEQNSLAEVKIEFEASAGELLLTAQESTDHSAFLESLASPPKSTEPAVHPWNIHQGSHAIATVTLSKEELMRERVQAAQAPQYLRCPYRCENCIIGFHYEENVIDHMIRRHGPKVGSITCEICLQVLYPPGSVVAHNFRHHTRYDCTRCGQRYSTFDDAITHYRKMHNSKETAFKCRICRFTTSTYSNLKVHKILQHHRYSCQFCGLMMSSATNLNKHLGAVHKKQATADSRAGAWCSQCDLTFKTRHALALHTARSLVHVPRDDKYKCSECGMKFAGVTHLRMHVESHGNITTHRCHHCPMEFTLELEMLEHIEAKHLEREKIMICDLCGRAYKNRQYFLRHMSVHNVFKRKNRTKKN